MGLRQRFLLIFSFVFAFALFPNAAYAESHNSLSGVAETIERLFGFIPNIITLEKLLGEDAAAMFWARFLLWVLLFAVFYYGGSFAFKVGEKVNTRIAGTVAFVFASISALLIPKSIITGIFQSYGLLSAILIWFVPVMAGFFLVSKIPTRPAKALIYLGMIFVLVAIDDSITSNFATDLADTIWFAFFKLLLAVVIIAFLWNLLFAGVEGWNAAVPGGGHGGGGGGEGRHGDGDHDGDREQVRPAHVRQAHVRPADRGPRHDEERRDEREMANEREIWNLLKRLRNNENLGRLITHPKDEEARDRVRINFGYIHNRTNYINRDIRKEIEDENDNERRQRLRQLRFNERKINDELMRLIREERNLLTRYRRSIQDLFEFIQAGNEGIERNIVDDQLKEIWQNASNAALRAMRFIELLIRINAREIERLEAFNE